MTGWSIELVLLLATVITVIYALIGGLEAIWADVIQCIIANLIFTAWATLTTVPFDHMWSCRTGLLGHKIVPITVIAFVIRGRDDVEKRTRALPSRIPISRIMSHDAGLLGVAYTHWRAWVAARA
jgi:Na+(H+)/acetate symporter ActP